MHGTGRTPNWIFAILSKTVVMHRNRVGLARCPVLFYPQGLTRKLMEYLRHKSFSMLIVLLEKIVDASLVASRKLLGDSPQLS